MSALVNSNRLCSFWGLTQPLSSSLLSGADKVGGETQHVTHIIGRHLHRDPVETTARKLADHDGGAANIAQSTGGMYRGITVEELSAKWHQTVVELAKRGITVTNADSALEGALSIRYLDVEGACCC